MAMYSITDLKPGTAISIDGQPFLVMSSQFGRKSQSKANMQCKLKNLKNKSGHSDNGAPRALLDLAFYRDFQAATYEHNLYDTEYSGWSNASRPRDQAMSLRMPNAGPGPR